MKNSAKRFISMMLSFLLIICMYSPIVSAAELGIDSTVLLNIEATSKIRNQFPEEIKYIEDCYDISINIIDQETMQRIKKVAIPNLDNIEYSFDEFMSALAWARVEAESGSLSSASAYVQYQTRASSDYGVLAGAHLMDVPVGSTLSVEYSDAISLAAGSEVDGVTLDQGYSTSFTYSVSGPSDGTTFGTNNNYTANHRTAFAVLYGTVVWSLFRGYHIEESTATVVVYTMLADVRIPTYCAPLSGGVLYFSDPNAYHNMIMRSPDIFI